MAHMNPITPRSKQPDLAPDISSDTTNGASSSGRSDFAPRNLSGPASAGPATATHASTAPVRVNAHHGAPLFSGELMSPNFRKAYDAAAAAISSDENTRHLQRTGKLSPEAANAIHRLASLVRMKSEDDRASRMARHVASEPPITPDEAAAWVTFATRLPDSFGIESAPQAQWKPVSEAELRETLVTENAFKAFMDQPEGERFVSELAVAMAMKSAEMKDTDKGFLFTMKFAHAYGTTNHIAAGSLWRDENGKLQMGIIHQESFPGTVRMAPSPTADASAKPKTFDIPASGGDTAAASSGIAVGKVYAHLDTTADHPDKRGTMIESIRLAGMPTVNLFPCPAPHAVPKLAKLLNSAGFHPYGPSQTWNNSERGKLPEERAFQCCFDITARAIDVAFQLLAPRVHLLPDGVDRMTPASGITPNQFATVEIPTAKGPKTVKVSDMNQLDHKAQELVFKAIGADWGRNEDWDVAPQFNSQIATLSIEPGTTVISLNAGQRFKFAGNTKGLTLDKQPVVSEKAYTAEEGRRMEYQGTQALKVRTVITTPTLPKGRTKPARL